MRRSAGQVHPRQTLERKGLKRIPHQNRRRLVPFHMHRGLTPAQIVIIHARQVVMNKAIGMQRLDRHGGGPGHIGCDPVQRRALDHQKPAQPLAT